MKHRCVQQLSMVLGTRGTEHTGTTEAPRALRCHQEKEGAPGRAWWALLTCSRFSFSLLRMSSISSRARSRSCRSFCQYFSSSFTALVFSSCSRWARQEQGGCGLSLGELQQWGPLPPASPEVGGPFPQHHQGLCPGFLVLGCYGASSALCKDKP